ncbi:hypothetical protein [Chenggangzhangella methanolivorans]|uniref:Uncharacterized protein n=1 Tax=Chenggangzhangella methanolivorans TaxID=1437009 RepID=A0A9E6UR12_9HYPH|nr:hypothetical protein [Chenggangzhangella methanolivorans]QZO01745.1 hypothetical protein K6K41_10455 [Chenggangzhangella methanolivorans]
MTAVAFQAPPREPTARAIDRRKIVRTSSDVARPLADAPRLPDTRIHPLAIWTPLAAYSRLSSPLARHSREARPRSFSPSSC